MFGEQNQQQLPDQFPILCDAHFLLPHKPNTFFEHLLLPVSFVPYVLQPHKPRTSVELNLLQKTFSATSALHHPSSATFPLPRNARISFARGVGPRAFEQHPCHSSASPCLRQHPLLAHTHHSLALRSTWVVPF